MSKKYDPAKAHEYYLKVRKLKNRHANDIMSPPARAAPNNHPTSATRPKMTTTLGTDRSHLSSTEERTRAVARVGRLKVKVSKIQGSLTAANNALVEKRQAAIKTAKQSSDGKTTVKERQTAKESRDKNKTKDQAKASQTPSSSSSSGGTSKSSASSSSSTSTTHSVADMSVQELVVRIGKIQTALRTARTQLSAAEKVLGSIAHSELLSDAGITVDFALHSTFSRKDSVKMTADFSGYATRNNVRCSDGRTILADAFKENDGMIVPLVWAHGHDEPTNVLGHVKLENRPDGVYCDAFFNATAAGTHAKEMVKHGDVKYLSIFANQLVERAKDVIKGNIREVSLVLAGANPGATIDNVDLVHSDGSAQTIIDEAYITFGEEVTLAHADATVTSGDDTKTLEQILGTMNEEQSDAVNYLLTQALLKSGDSSVQHGDTDADASAAAEGASSSADAAAEDGDNADADANANAASTEGEDANADANADASNAEGTDANASDAPAEGGDDNGADNGDATASAEGEGANATDNGDNNGAGDAVQHDNTNQEDKSMTHNVFDQSGAATGARPSVSISHDDIKGIVAQAKKRGSLKDAVEDYVTEKGVKVNGTLQHGIENIDYLFPDSKLLENSPAFVSRRMEWVDKVLSGVRKSPFSRIKTITADITPDEARARGYIKGNMKNEEYFALAKRETTPQTVYKKQKLDRDDVIDIVDLDVVAWLKAEMKVMLDEELAGAILIGDGRSGGDDDKILETHIRPIASDAELYVTTVDVNLDDASSSIDELVDEAITHRQYYKGTGQPTFYTSEAIIAKFLTMKDSFGRRIYSSTADVAAVLRVSDIVPVEIFDRVPDVVGIMVNLADYTLGADRGGIATMFDDFDIDYNKLLYLIETRCSGALTQPKSALVFRKVAGSAVLVTPSAPAHSGNVITVPTVTGVVYKDGAGTTLTTGSPVTLSTGQSLHVVATPASGKYFEDNVHDEWDYEYGVGG